MWKHHYLIPICLITAIGIAVLVYVWNTGPLPTRYNIAAGIAAFESRTKSTSQHFELPIPAPVDGDLFSGPLRSTDPIEPDLVAHVRCEYALTDRDRLHASRPLGETHQEETIVRDLEINVSYTMLMVRDFPIRRDAAGFYYGSESYEGRSRVTHRFDSQDMDQLATESITYFLSILPLAAHDQRHRLLQNDIIQIPGYSE